MGRLELLDDKIYRHGKSDTRLYYTWKAMKKRCLNKSDPNFKNYGGRGICLALEWMKFVPFYNWAIVSGYSPNLSIDRIDNNKGYSPDNCRWASKREQSINKRTTTSHHNIEKRGGSYRVRFEIDGNVIFLGSFNNLKSAIYVRDSYINNNLNG